MDSDACEIFGKWIDFCVLSIKFVTNLCYVNSYVLSVCVIAQDSFGSARAADQKHAFILESLDLQMRRSGDTKKTFVENGVQCTDCLMIFLGRFLNVVYNEGGC